MRRTIMTHTTRRKMSRRAVLRGGLGTLVSLPLLEWGVGGSSRAFAQAAAEHTRLLVFYLPNGIIQDRWWPGSGSERSFSLEGTSLAPLERHKGALTIFKNFRNAGATSGSGNAHMRAIAGFLTGSPIPNDRITTHATSFDQVLANHYDEVARTPIHSLQLAGNNKIDPPNSGTSYNNALKNALACDQDGRIMPTTADLRSVFDKLFQGSGGPTASERDAQERAFLRRSVLDYVTEERQGLSGKLGHSDAKIVEQYFDSVRALEQRLEAFEQQTGQTCGPGGDSDRPKTYRDDVDNHYIIEHAQLMADMMVLAFQCDVTRVVTYMSSGEASKTKYPELGIDLKFHDTISHNQGAHKDKHARIDSAHADAMAYLIDAFERTPHGEGTLLDGSCLLFGSGLGNGDAHSMGNIGCLMAGRFGSVRPGAFYSNMQNRPHSELLNTLRDQMNIPAAKFAGRPGGTLDLS